MPSPEMTAIVRPIPDSQGVELVTSLGEFHKDPLKTRDGYRRERFFLNALGHTGIIARIISPVIGFGLALPELIPDSPLVLPFPTENLLAFVILVASGIIYTAHEARLAAKDRRIVEVAFNRYLNDISKNPLNNE